MTATRTATNPFTTHPRRSASMKTSLKALRSLAFAAAIGASLLAPMGAQAQFVSGSTGADLAFNPLVNTTIQLPPGGIFNYTSVNIPAGVTVSYTKNATNTPVVILATGDVTIAGTLSVAGGASPPTGSAGGGAQGDDGLPGLGGPGGYDGGRGGRLGTSGGTGLGPGGGGAGVHVCAPAGCYYAGGGGGGFAGGGGASYIAANYGVGAGGGAAYGSAQLLPLVGGSGGGGGNGGGVYEGSGGGGGGGAILIAASGTVNVTGLLYAYGGASGASQGGAVNNGGGTGGGGSGGAIRIIATTIAGNGTIHAGAGSNGGNAETGWQNGGAGANGRVRLEAQTITRTAATIPTASADLPGSVFVAGLPTLTISSVAGVAAPAVPTGNADITLPANTPNPVTIVFTTSGVPVGNTVTLTVSPAYGPRVTATTPALVGTNASATASVTITLPVGPSVLSAQTTYTVLAALGDLLQNFAGNERVEKITLTATLGGKPKMTLITVSGKSYDAPEEALRIAAAGG